jgi:signal transduction histidine kinase
MVANAGGHNRCKPAPTLGRTPFNELCFLAQEAVNNAIRRSDASKLSIQCEVENLHFTMTVMDNGKPKPSAESDRGPGLRIMDYRSRSIGGSLQVRASARGGFTVSCGLPLQSSSMEPDV